MKLKIMIMALLLLVGIGAAVNYLPTSKMVSDADLTFDGGYIIDLPIDSSDSYTVATVGHTRDNDFVVSDYDNVTAAMLAAQDWLVANIVASNNNIGVIKLDNGSYTDASTFVFESGIVVEIPFGTELIGSDIRSEYTNQTSSIQSYTDNYVNTAMFWADSKTHIGIIGGGTINGSGTASNFTISSYTERPYMIRFIGCSDFIISGNEHKLELNYPAMWTQHYIGCSKFSIDNVKVYSLGIANGDGIDIDNCDKFMISNCDIKSSDDSICFKSTYPEATCSNGVVTNCVLFSTCAAIKFGTESHGGFSDIAISNIAIPYAATSAIALYVVDGADMSQISINGVSVLDANSAINIKLGGRNREPYSGAGTPSNGTLSDILINNIVGNISSVYPMWISGMDSAKISDVVLSNIDLIVEGGSTNTTGSTSPPEAITSSPNYDMHGTIAAYGIWIRHAENIVLDNCNIQTLNDDGRYSVLLDDVDTIKIDGFNDDYAEYGVGGVRCENVTECTITNSNVGSLKIVTTDNIIATNNIINCMSAGYLIDGIYIITSDNIILLGNDIYATSNGVNIFSDVNNIIISNNLIDSCYLSNISSPDIISGIYSASGPTGGSFSNNIINLETRVSTRGISINNAKNVSIIGNGIYGATGVGIRGSGTTDYGTIIGNIIHAGLADISFDGTHNETMGNLFI